MLEQREQRDREFMAACRRQMRRMYDSGEAVDTDEVIRQTMMSEAPAYYVSFGYAQRVVSSLLRGGDAGAEDNSKVGSGRSDRRRMMLEIAAKCRKLMEANKGMTVANALSHVLIEERASSWFISPSYARRLFYLIKSDPRHRQRRRTRKLF